METAQINRLIDRARKAWLRSAHFNGKTAVIADSDIIVERDGRNVVELRDGDVTVARYSVRPCGELRLLTKQLH